MNTTFKTFITESRNTTISKEEAFDIIKNNCIHNLYDTFNTPSSPRFLYRGVLGVLNEKYGLFGLINTGSTNTNRESRNSTNLINIFFSRDPSWNHIPSREKSIICSTRLNTAQAYADDSENAYYVIPFDGTKIAVCNKNDLYDAFLPVSYYLVSFFLMDIAAHFKYKDHNLHQIKNFSDVKDFENFLNDVKTENQVEWKKNIIDLISLRFDEPSGRSIMADEFASDKNINLINFFRKYFKADDEIKIIKSLSQLPSGDHEVWFEGKAVIIKHTYFKTIKDQLKELVKDI